MRAFVAGGSGFLGRGMTEALLSAGWQVRCQVRSRGKSVFGEELGVEKFAAAEQFTGRFAQGMQGCDAVFNFVGIIREFTGKGVTFRKAHPQFTGMLLDACREAGIKRCLHMSALAVDSGLNIGYNVSKLASEKLVRESGLDWTIVRPSLIFGPGDRFALEFAAWIKKGIPIPLIGKGDYRLMPVSRKDLCQGMVKLIDMKESFGKTYNIGGAEKMSYLEVLRVIEQAAGRKTRLIKLPAGLVILAAKLLGRFQRFPASADMIKQLLNESVTDESDFWRITGIQPNKLEDEIREYVN